MFLLEYTVALQIDGKTEIMHKKKLYSSVEKANEFQNQYNLNFKDRKIIHYLITFLETDIDWKSRPKDVDKLI